MKLLLLVCFLLLFLADCFTQQLVQLHLKKNGRVKKRIELGSPVLVITKKNEVCAGPIIQLRRDSVYFNNRAVALKDIDCIKLPRTKARMKFNWEEFGYVSLGVGLTTTGLIFAKWQEYPGALHTAAAIGYSPYFFRFVKSISLKKRKFRMGRRYSLRIWDIR